MEAVQSWPGWDAFFDKYAGLARETASDVALTRKARPLVGQAVRDLLAHCKDSPAFWLRGPA